MILTERSLPLISCLLVTAAGRFDFFRRSVRCYLDQTYPNRELVVVNEGPKDYQKQIADHLSGRTDVRFVFLDGKYTLGALRNIAVGLCHGELFVQWDDDDYSTPERIAVQYAYLKNRPEARICYFSDQLHYYFTTKRLFWNDWSAFHSGNRKEYSLIPGTIMAYTDGFDGRYPSAGAHCSAGEDSILALQFLKDADGHDLEDTSKVLLMHGQGYMQAYTFHGSNVWDTDHHMKICRERCLPISHLLAHRERLCRTLNYFGLPGPIRVTGREGLAFTWGGV